MVETPPPPSRGNIGQVTVERVELYNHVPPPCRSIPVEFTPFPVQESILREVEILGRSSTYA